MPTTVLYALQILTHLILKQIYRVRIILLADGETEAPASRGLHRREMAKQGFRAWLPSPRVRARRNSVGWL